MKKLLVAVTLGLFAVSPAFSDDDGHKGHHDHSAHQHEEDNDFDAGDKPADGSVYWLEGTWTTDTKAKISLRQFEGKPVILTLLYTSCKAACPVLIEDLKRTQAALTEAERKRVQFVIVSIDPQRDTPDAMAAFKAKIPVAKTWTFLQGSSDQVLELAGVLGVRYKKIAGDDYLHSNKITVLDQEGEVAHQTVGLRAPAGETVKAVRKLLK